MVVLVPFFSLETISGGEIQVAAIRSTDETYPDISTLDPHRNHKKRVVVLKHLQGQLIQEHHLGDMGDHFVANKLY